MTENPLGYEKISKLLKDFAIPSIMASLVGSIYNIVDQIFIGQGVGYLGNAATNVAYPFSTICLAIALLVGIGSASRVSLCLGRKEPKAAAKAAGNGIVLMGIFGIIYLLVGEAFLSLLLKAFGATTDVFPYAKQYASITLIGMLCWHTALHQSTILWIRFLLVKGSVIWEMQQPMLPTRSLPSALLLHCWLELAVLPVFPSVLDAKSRKLPPKQREMVLF